MDSYDIVIAGAGFAGIYALYEARRRGLSAIVLEDGGGVGGTWYWNSYPGARCDIESVDYSYSFSKELEDSWVWSEKYAAQPEILAYINHVVDRFGLRDHIRLNHSVAAARLDEDTHRWVVTANGTEFSGRYFVMATGLLSVPIRPAIDGLANFEGQLLHTGSWPPEGVAFEGKRVGIIGTGSSAIQAVPVIAETAAHLTVFQRTATYGVPARNGPMTSESLEALKSQYPDRREKTRQSFFGTIWAAFDANPEKALEVSSTAREREYARRWENGGYGFVAAYSDLLTDIDANRTAADYLRTKIREAVVDPVTAERLVPKENLPFACKRLCITNGYYEAFNQDNVSLVHLPDDPIREVVSDGVLTSSGMIPLDTLILASGFDALTGAILKVDIRGVSGRALRDHWADGPRDYLGFMCAGFPNLFMINGPHGAAGNFVMISEHAVNWVLDLIEHADGRGVVAVDTTLAAEDEWLNVINVTAGKAIASSGCDSWFNGGNVAGKSRGFLTYFGGQGEFARLAAGVRQSGYQNLVFSHDETVKQPAI